MKVRDEHAVGGERVFAFISLLVVVFFSPGEVAAQITLDPNAPEPIAPLKGSLVLAGGGELPDAIFERFINLAGGVEARIVIVPTAADEGDGVDSKAVLEAWREREVESITVLHTRSHDESNTPAFVRPIEEATGVWFTGGDQARLSEVYHDSAFEQALHALMERGGVIGATSGATAAMTRVMIDGGNPQAFVGRGFDLLPGSVADQHFSERGREARLMGVLSSHPGLVGFGIDEATALVVHSGRRLEVIGDGGVHVYLAANEHLPWRVDHLTQSGRSFRNGAGVSRVRDRGAYQADLPALTRAAMARTQRRFPALVPPVPEVRKGTLAIVGGGRIPTGFWGRFIEYAGGPDAMIVVIPTASGAGEDYDGTPREVGSLRAAGAQRVAVLHTTIREKSDRDEAFLAPLREAGGVWFGGGRQWRLVDSYQNTVAHQLMLDVLERGGIIGGSSAGASIQGDYMARGDPMGPRKIMADGYETGLGFLVGVAIDQHFHQRNRMADLASLVDTYPQLLGIGLDEGTAIIVQGTIAEVIGTNTVSFYDRTKPVIPGELDHELLKAGMKYDLKGRRIVE